LAKHTRLFIAIIGLALILVGLLFVSSVAVSAVSLSLSSGLSDVRVVDLSGNSVVGASVSVVAYYGAPLANGLTDSYGMFSFDPALVPDGPASITAYFNGYSAQGIWYSEYWADTMVLTLNFNAATPTPYPTYNPTPTPTTTYPTPTPTWHPTSTPVATPNPTNPIIPIPNNPTNNTLLAILGGVMIGGGIFLILIRKYF
jgi:hypothetical protein